MTSLSNIQREVLRSVADGPYPFGGHKQTYASLERRGLIARQANTLRWYVTEQGLIELGRHPK